ncbi:lysophosphatidylserine lipase ABHD12-like isoform X1 [Asterias amurensis]|uniref:lysophosphatidylserine lipase ABHD12-like isoform X1 n=1 Tax=Asterias amurensis TaxID=7602 RepID=UPI003AB7DECF
MSVKRRKAETSGETNGVSSEEKDSNLVVEPKRANTSPWNSFYKKMAFILCIYLLVPAFTSQLPFIAKQFLYLSLVKSPLHSDFEKPETLNMSGTRNVRIGTLPPDDDIQLGLWQILPQSSQIGSSIEQDHQFDSALSDGKPVIIYLHGNAGTRAASHRLLLYKLLAGMDFHVIAPDYRGFGDSSGWPSAEGVVGDAESAYRWAKERSKHAPIYVWGHSMGSGIGSAMVKKICNSGSCPEGLILEAPYNSMQDAMRNHLFTMPWWILPGSLSLFSLAYEQEEAMFDSQENLKEVNCPVLILHAEDDFVVPYKLGKQLYEFSVENRDKSLPPVTFHSFGYVGYGHRHIVDSPDLSGVIRDFMK